MSRAGRFGSDAPDGIAYLPLAGGEMTGDITMAGAQLVDGVDISAHAADLDAHTKNPLQVHRTGDGWAIGGYAWYAGPTNHAFSANRLYAAPFLVPRTMTFDRIAIQVGTGSGAANARLGIYADGTNLYPGALVLDAGIVSVASAALVTITINQQLTKGLYWMACLTDGTPSLYTIYGCAQILGLSSGHLGSPNQGWCVTQTYGALPDPFTAGGIILNAEIPLVVLRPASMD